MLTFGFFDQSFHPILQLVKLPPPTYRATSLKYFGGSVSACFMQTLKGGFANG